MMMMTMVVMVMMSISTADGFDFGYAMYELHYRKYLHIYTCLMFGSNGT
jgi:hypothetical protein